MIFSAGPTSATPAPFSRGESQYYTALTRLAFLKRFVDAGCIIEPPVAIASGVDPTVRFVGSHISVLKPYLREHRVPSEGVVCLQDCVRTRNVKQLGNVEFNPRWGSYFQSLGVLLPVTDLERGSRIIIDFLTKDIGCPVDRLIARVSAADTDLHAVCHAIVSPEHVEVDSRPAAYYRHKIGEPAIIGRNFNLAISPPGESDAYDIGNVIILELEGRPHAIELAFGVSTILSYVYGLSHILDCHPFIGLENTCGPSGARRQLEDIMITGAALFREGLTPINSDNRTRLLRRYMSVIPTLAAILDTSREELRKMLGHYMVREYNDFSVTIQNAMLGDESFVASLIANQVIATRS